MSHIVAICHIAVDMSNQGKICPKKVKKMFYTNGAPYKFILLVNLNQINLTRTNQRGQFKSNVSLYLLYYAEACNELAGPISVSLRLGNTASFEEMLQRWLIIGNTVSDLTSRDLNLRPPVSETNMLPLDQLAGTRQFRRIKFDAKIPN